MSDDARVWVSEKWMQYRKKWCESCLRACWEGAQGAVSVCVNTGVRSIGLGRWLGLVGPDSWAAAVDSTTWGGSTLWDTHWVRWWGGGDLVLCIFPVIRVELCHILDNIALQGCIVVPSGGPVQQSFTFPTLSSVDAGGVGHIWGTGIVRHTLSL